MIVHEVEQNSGDWWALRLGLVTASAACDVLKGGPKWATFGEDGEIISRHNEERTAAAAATKLTNKGTPAIFESFYERSTATESRMDKILAEWAMGAPIMERETYWMERGHELEPEAWRWVEMRMDVDVRRGGFITDDTGRIGYSPDGRIYNGDKLFSLVELKCPAPQTHMGYLRRPESLAADYRHQLHTGLAITGCDVITIVSYHPLLPPAMLAVTTADDVEYREALWGELQRFAGEVEEAKQALREQGITGKREAAA